MRDLDIVFVSVGEHLFFQDLLPLRPSGAAIDRHDDIVVPHMKTNDGMTALMFAAQWRDINMIDWLKRAGAKE